MTNRHIELVIFVEGEDDALFFKSIIKPLLDKIYAKVRVVQYQGLKKAIVDNMIKAILSNGDTYILVHDKDLSGCITLSKNEILKIYSAANNNNLILIIREIEGWYLAGIDNVASSKLGIRVFNNTDTITKTLFNSLWKKKYYSKIDFLQEILRKYSNLEIALQKNSSLKYFIDKYYTGHN